MEYPKYIQHIDGEESRSSFDIDVFIAKSDDVTRRDTVSLYDMSSRGDHYTCTVGKRIAPEDLRDQSCMYRWMFIYVVSGALKCYDAWLGEGDYAYVPSDYLCPIESGKERDTVYYWFTSDDQMLNSFLTNMGFGKNPVTGKFSNVGEVRKICEKMIYEPHSDMDCRTYFGGAILQLLSMAHAEKKTSRTSGILFERCLVRIEYEWGRTTVDRLSKKYFLSRQHLYRLFMKEIGISPSRYIQNTKMEAAAKLLLSTDKTIMQIAEDFDYRNYNHFSQAFKRHFGCLPTEYRKLHKKT